MVSTPPSCRRTHPRTDEHDRGQVAESQPVRDAVITRAARDAELVDAIVPTHREAPHELLSSVLELSRTGGTAFTLMPR